MKNTALFFLCFLCLLAWNACQNAGNKPETSNAWVVYDMKGDLTLFGKKTEFGNLKTILSDSLAKMKTPPATIPIQFTGEVPMRMRGEIETEVNEALRSVVARKTCEETIHGFYAWYDKFAMDETKQIDFVDDSGSHLKLDQPKLDAYLAQFKASGFISDEWIAGQKAFYIKCEKLWVNEEKGDVPSGMDADPVFCAQDWEVDYWTKSPVTITLTGDRAAAILKGTEGGSPREQKFDMKNENGKWLITKIECDMGVE